MLWPTSGYCRGDGLTHPILITAYHSPVDPKVTESFCNEVWHVNPAGTNIDAFTSCLRLSLT